jgi:rhodanese-related sulfurtransferase
VDDAKKLYDEKDVTVLDVVDTGTFEKIPYKVKDAIHIAPEDVREEFSKLPKDRHVLAYCT